VLGDRLNRRAKHSGTLNLGYVTARQSIVGAARRLSLRSRLID
jgi:hypothetical protein